MNEKYEGKVFKSFAEAVNAIYSDSESIARGDEIFIVKKNESYIVTTDLSLYPDYELVEL